MTCTVMIYGFGSYFNGRRDASNDIDILVLHCTIARDSINLAIRTKAFIIEFLPKAHVVMLSASEERELDLIRKSGASFLAALHAESLRQGVACLVADMLARESS